MVMTRERLVQCFDALGWSSYSGARISGIDLRTIRRMLMGAAVAHGEFAAWLEERVAFSISRPAPWRCNRLADKAPFSLGYAAFRDGQTDEVLPADDAEEWLQGWQKALRDALEKEW